MNDTQVKIVDDKKSGSGRLIFEGDLTIMNSSQLKGKLHDLLDHLKYDSLVVFIQNVSDIDLSFLQLMEVLGNHLTKKGIAYSVKWDMGEETKDLLKKTGFDKYA